MFRVEAVRANQINGLQRKINEKKSTVVPGPGI